jgi:Holliday junction resolvasome RuvABC endonuclease subunit
MRNRPVTILAINPGSRYLGIAVFHGAELYDWALKVIPRANLAEVVSGYIKNHCVNVLALKKLHPSRTSKTLRDLISKVKTLAQKNDLRMHEYSNDEVKMFFCPHERANKRRIMEDVAVRYPFLLPEMQHEQKLKTTYRLRMFEAVAIGIVCFNGLDGKKEKGRK